MTKLPCNDVLITAYREMGRPLDPLAYTNQFEELLVRAHVLSGPVTIATAADLAVMSEGWQRYQYLRKKGYLPKFGRTV